MEQEGIQVEFERPEVLCGVTRKLKAPCGGFFITLNDHEGHLREVRMTIGKSGTCMNILLQTISILISVMLQSNISRDKIRKTLEHQFEGHCGNLMYYGGEKFHSCIDFAVTKILETMACHGEIKLEEEETAIHEP